MSENNQIDIIVKCYISSLIVYLPFKKYFGLGILEEYYTIFGVFLLSITILVCICYYYKSWIGFFCKLDFWFGIFIIYRLIRAISSEAINEIIIYEKISLILLYLLCRLVDCSKCIITFIIVAGSMQSLLAILQQFSIFEGHHFLFQVTGTFANPGPLGGFLAISFIMTLEASLYCLRKKNRWLRSYSILGIILIGYILILSNSRAAWVATIFVLLLSIRKYTWWQSLIKNKLHIIVGGIIFISLIIGLLLYKWDSVLGRMLVWRVSTDMIAEKPWIGHGTNSFRGQYMIYQAEYFKEKPDSLFSKVADDVSYSYNELIKLLVEGGIIGLAIFIMILFILWHSSCNIAIRNGLTTLVIFSLFSYPFEIYVFKVFFVIMCASNCKVVNLSISQKESWRGIITCSILIGLNVCLIRTYVKERACYEILKYNPAFMSFYAKQIYLAESSEKALPVLKDMAKVFPCTDLYCDIGKVYENLQKDDKAEEYYEIASSMVPSKIRPRWYLFLLYLKKNSISEAENMAFNILSTPPKVENTISILIKAYLEDFLKKKNKLKNDPIRIEF